MSMRRIAVLLALCAAAPGLLVGCSWSKTKRAYDRAADFVFDVGPTSEREYDEDKTPMMDLNYEAADEMTGSLRSRLPKDSPLFVKSFVNMMDARDLSPFGRVVAEQVAARLVANGFAVTAGEPYVPTPPPAPDEPNKQPATVEQKPSVLTGTYILGQDVIFISATVTALTNDAVLAAYQWNLPINDNMRALLPQLVRPGEGMTPTVRTSF